MATVATSGATIELYQGSNVTFRVTVVDTADDPVDLTGASLVFTVRKAVACEPALLRKTTDLPSEGAITDPTGGIAELYIVPSDTGVLLPGGYVFDLWVDALLPNSTSHILIKPSPFSVLDPVRSWPDP